MDNDKAKRSKHMVENLMRLNSYNKPLNCLKCGGVMEYSGSGEYCCEVCGYIDYDDYGKVRNYLEKHGGATISEVSRATGVGQNEIHDMLQEARLSLHIWKSPFRK